KTSNGTNEHAEQQDWINRHDLIDSNQQKLEQKIQTRINDDWLEGEYQDSIGIFPLNHVELFPIEINKQDDYLYEYENDYDIEGEAIVKHDFIPQQTFELQLRKGDKVILLRKIDNYWYEGRANHIEGIFPAAYVETLKEPAGKKKEIFIFDNDE
ncbi:unnamed protein product, partial [Rotaria sp. Silwood2]